jgi:hypothetical protein
MEQRAPRITISRYLDEVRRSDHDRARLLNKSIQDNRRNGRAFNHIIATGRSHSNISGERCLLPLDYCR